MEYSDIAKEIVYMGLADWVYLGEASSFVTARNMAATDEQAPPIVLKEIKQLADGGLIEIGSIGDEGFVPWQRTVDESLQYIASHAANIDNWDAITWLRNTQRGNEYAETLDPDAFIEDE